MAVVLLKMIEEAHLSGELKLSGRKLKEFPKAATKYNLSDTVIAGKLMFDAWDSTRTAQAKPCARARPQIRKNVDQNR